MSLSPQFDLSAEYLRDAIQGMAVAVIVVDEQGRCRDANAAATSLLGYPRDQIRRRAFSEFAGGPLPPLPWNGPPVEMPVRAEVRLRRQDGSTVDAAISVSEVHGPEGRLFVCVIEDTSARRRAEAALRESEDVRHLVLSSIQAPVMELSDDLVVVVCNDAYAHLIGRDGAELVGRSLVEAIPELAGGEIHAALLRARSSGEVQDVDGWLADVHLASRILTTASGLLVLSEDLGERRRMEEALRESEARFRLIVETTPDLISVLDREGCVRFVNSAHERVLGYATEQLIGRPISEFIHPEDGPALAGRLGDLLAEVDAHRPPRTGTHELVCRSRHADGHWIDIEARWQALTSAGGGLIGVLMIARDVTERRRTEAALRLNEQRFRSLVQHASDLVMIADAEGTVRYVSPAIDRLLGYAPEDVTGTAGLSWVHPDDRGGVESLLRRRLANTGARETLEFRVRHRDGSWRQVEAVASNLLNDSSVGGIVFNAHDVTERKRLEDQLTHQAFHDPLTGLPNRALLLDRIEQSLARAGRRSSALAVLLLDLDRFKVVNESLGYEAGDRLLVQVGQRLAGCLEPGDTLARLGGDEFIVLMDDIAEGGDPRALAGRLLATLRAPFDVAGRIVHAGASIGIVVAGAQHRRAADLLRDADIALYEAKAAGKGRAVQFTPSMFRAARQLDLETGLREAIERDQLTMGYQPIVDLGSGTVVALESLARWMHPVRGAIRPTEFIPIAEESGLIVELWKRLVETACRRALEWQRLRPDGPPVRIGVNVSAGHIQQPELAAQVAAVLARTGLDPTCLILEITENALLQDANAALTSMRALKELGVHLAIDDFGTGYSALSYLRRFPADSIKVDRSFVLEVASDRGAAAIVKAICTLGHALGMAVVLEGVERAEQLAGVRGLAADQAQGYYFSRPLPPSEVPAVLGIGAYAARLRGLT